MRALAFVMNRQSRFYVGRLQPEEVAEVLASACGHWGSCAEYLHNTVAHLQEHGVRDCYLWRLQALVAERIGATAARNGHPATTATSQCSRGSYCDSIVRARSAK